MAKATSAPKPFLPKPLYEAMRHINWIVLPAVGVLLTTVNAAWNFGLPMDAILATIAGVETFLGTVLCLAKYKTDN